VVCGLCMQMSSVPPPLPQPPSLTYLAAKRVLARWTGSEASPQAIAALVESGRISSDIGNILACVGRDRRRAELSVSPYYWATRHSGSGANGAGGSGSAAP